MADVDTPTEFDPAPHVAAIDVRGYTILRSVVPDDLRTALVERIDEVMESAQIQFGANRFLGLHTRRIFNLLSRDSLFARVPLFEPALRVAEQVLDPELQVASVTAIEMNPGQAPQPFHADDGSIPLPRPHVPLSCVAIWALTDFTVDNGGTRVVPGSHRFDRRPAKGEEPEWEQVVMPAGSIVVYNGSMWHGGGPNTTTQRRLAIVSQYSAGWIRQEENQLLGLRREQVAAFPPRLRKMVGYGTYRGLLGHVDQVDPATWFDPEADTDMIWRKMR